MKTKEGRDLPIEQITAENYLVPEKERGVYHVVIEVVQFDAKTGVKLSRPRVQKFGRKAFEGGVRDHLIQQGYTLRILHTPDTNAVAEQRVAAAKKAAEAKRQAEIDEAVKKAVAEALAAKKTEAPAGDAEEAKPKKKTTKETSKKTE